MIYESKERAMVVAAEMNARSANDETSLIAARTKRGWTIIERSPYAHYSHGSILEYAA